jgi:hypothetical protein
MIAEPQSTRLTGVLTDDHNIMDFTLGGNRGHGNGIPAGAGRAGTPGGGQVYFTGRKRMCSLVSPRITNVGSYT